MWFPVEWAKLNNMEKIKVYVGCGLTHAPSGYKEAIAIFKQQLSRVLWIEVLEFVTPNSVSSAPDSRHIYRNDIYECVGMAHAMIGDLSYPSTGLGWELGTAIEKHGIRVFMCMHKDATVSHLPIGAQHENNHATLHTYEESILDLLDYFIEELQQLHQVLQLKKALP